MQTIKNTKIAESFDCKQFGSICYPICTFHDNHDISHDWSS